MKVLTVVGARPQFIKAAVLSRKFSEIPEVQEVIVHTGQHYDKNMSEVFFQQMDIPKPDYNLGVSGLSHGAMTGRMLEKIEEVLLKEKPDRVIVYGDTNSTLAAGLAAVKIHIPVAHVEAGLRSFNMRMPEEINRILVDRISDKLFCPTEVAVNNLKNEGFANFNGVEMVKSGDIMEDAAKYYSDRAQCPRLGINGLCLDDEFCLITLHRAENTDDHNRLLEIWNAFLKISKSIPCLFLIHPRTRKIMVDLGAFGQDEVTCGDNLHIVPPVGYLEMIYLLQKSSLVLTDSGGLQKEAFFFCKPCVTLRDETEWMELVDNGYNILAGGDIDKIVTAVNSMRNKKILEDSSVYGGGRAADMIVSSLVF